MKACLLFSPFSSASYVPLGVSYLKGFIEKEDSSIEVKNIDLSNTFHHNLDKLDFLVDIASCCRACSRYKKVFCKGIFRNTGFQNKAKAASVAKSILITDYKTVFCDIAKYNKLRFIYDSFYRGVASCMNCILKHSLESRDTKRETILSSTIYKEDLKRIASLKPDIVGFSVFSQEQIFYSLKLAEFIKLRLGAKIVLGGAFISHVDQKKLLENFDFIDFIIYKEGELGLLALLRGVKSEEFKKVHNLVYRRDGRIFINQEKAIEDLDRLPFPDFSDFDIRRYFNPRPVISTLFSRGCYWKGCTYCAHHLTYSNPYRKRSISNFLREMRYYREAGIRHICLADEIISSGDMYKISKALIAEDFKMKFLVTLKPAEEFTSKIFNLMSRAGVKCIVWGVESFSQRILDLMNKGMAANRIPGILKNSYDAGIANIVYMITGFPTQTEKEIIDDARILRQNSSYIRDVTMHKFWLEKDTAIYKNQRKFGLLLPKRKLLLQTKKSRLWSPNINIVTYKNKAMTRKSKKTKRIKLQKFNDAGFLYSKEHILLHLSETSSHIAGRTRSTCHKNPA